MWPGFATDAAYDDTSDEDMDEVDHSDEDMDGSSGEVGGGAGMGAGEPGGGGGGGGGKGFVRFKMVMPCDEWGGSHACAGCGRCAWLW